MPLYLQIKKHVVDRIDSGEWGVGVQIPTEEALMETFQTSRMTVHRALRELAAEGRLTRRQGSGTFVAPTRSYLTTFEIKSIASEIAERGGHHTAKVLKRRKLLATREIADALQLPLRSLVYQVKILHYDDRTPTQVEDRIVNAGLTPDFIDQDFRLTTPSAFLLSKSLPTKVEHTIAAVSASAEIAKLLQISKGDPVLQLTRRTWRGPTISTRADFFHPGSTYQIGGTTSLEQTELRVA